MDQFRSLAMTVISLGLGLHPVVVHGDTLSRTDKLRVLYSNQFSFNSRGIPLITIGIIEGTDSVELQGERPIRVLPEGEGGAEVVGGRRWKIELKSSRAAKVQYFAVIGRETVSGLSKLRAELPIWRKRRARTEMLEVGSVYGMSGRVFDNRALLLTDGPYDSVGAAARHAERYLTHKWVNKVETVAQLKRRPAGTIEAVDLDTGTHIRARDAIWFAPADARHVIAVRSARNRSGAFTGQLGGRYRGQLYVTIDRVGKLAVVNALPADQLLAGLVSSETYPSAPPAALQAQAVAARGNLLAKIGRQSLADPYLTCAWARCQVYKGVGFEHPRTTAAVQKTRGLVLMRKDGVGLVDAVYHAVSGGFTEDNDQVWPGPPDPALRGHLDAPSGEMTAFASGIRDDNIRRWLAARPSTWGARAGVNRNRLRWSVRRAVTTLAKTLAEWGAPVGIPQRINPLVRGRSGRINLVEVTGTRGTHRIRGELAIRRALGNLNSSMFVVDAVRDKAGTVVAFEFKGGGWGHGVGMSQTGAIGMAKSGKDFRFILSHYYANSEVTRVY